MAKELEDLIRGIAAAGELNHLTVSFRKGAFECSFRTASNFDHGFASDKDPVKAMVKCITETRHKKVRTKLAQREAPEPEADGEDDFG